MGGGGFLRSFFRRFRVRLVNYQKLTAALLSKLSVILLLTVFEIKNLLFSSMIFYLRLAKFFLTAYPINSCHLLMNKFLVVYRLLCHTTYYGIHRNVIAL